MARSAKNHGTEQRAAQPQRSTLAQKRAWLAQQTIEQTAKVSGTRNWLAAHRVLTISVLGVVVICISGIAVVTGQASWIANIYPGVRYGAKQTTLSCDYAGEHMTVTTTEYANINAYYQHNQRKRGLTQSGDFAKYVYSSSHDHTITDLADKIRQLGIDNNLNSDQVLELATCFIQNIPYDKTRGESVLASGNSDMGEQYPYQTLYRNAGICTDKTYLGSALLKALGYGVAIFVFPSEQHMALGISAPAGYTDFESQYVMMELTTPGFAPGEVPNAISQENGKPVANISKLSDLSIHDNPADVKLDSGGHIDAPAAVIKVADGQSYTRIIAVENLEKKILGNLKRLRLQVSTLTSAYGELQSRKSSMYAAESNYELTDSTKLDCGYKYDYSYSYFDDYYSPYSYSSPYTYRCDTVSNPEKDYALSRWEYAEDSYNSQVDYYNSLLASYKSNIGTTQQEINQYKGYDYN